MPADLTLFFSSGARLKAKTVPRPATGGRGIRIRGSFGLTILTPAAAVTSSSFICFSKVAQFPDSGHCKITIGTAGLIENAWGTVLDVVHGHTGNVRVEEDDWGNVLGVGLSSERRDITARCRLLIGGTIPRRGTFFRHQGRTFIVLETTRHWTTRTVCELTVTGARWEDIPNPQVDDVPDILQSIWF